MALPTGPRLYGFPVPGPQSPTPSSALARDYFVRQSTWEAILDHGNFDYIVIGSSFMALAFISEAYKIDPEAKILCLERGDFWLPSHFQNLPLPTKLVLDGTSETFPWTLSETTFKEHGIPGLTNTWVGGACPFFGGKSTIWSSWCPRPPAGLLEEFPDKMKEAAQPDKFWMDAGKLLGVTKASEIRSPIWDVLQQNLDKRISEATGITGKTYNESGPMAVSPRSPTSTVRFNKNSVPGPLLRIFEEQRLRSKDKPKEEYPFQMAINCAVQRLGHASRGGFVRSLETTRGTLSFTGDKTKIILCAGAIPNTTLVLNSFKDLRGNAGRRLTGHFISSLTVRYPKKIFGDLKKFELGAHYLAGENPKTKTKQQYHIHITATHSPDPKNDEDDFIRESPDFAACPTKEQLKGSEDYVICVLAAIGQIQASESGNVDTPSSSFVQLNDGADPTCNIEVQYQLTLEDKDHWDLVDRAMGETILALAGNDATKIEYWNNEPGQEGWTSKQPHVSNIRIPRLTHEASTLFMGKRENGGSVDDHYRVYGTNNVYVTGSALFPSAGSWNPTLAMCGFAQHLAQKIVDKPLRTETESRA